MVRSVKKNGARNVDVSEISLDECAKICAELSDTKPEDAWSGTQLGTKLHTITSEVSEAFFGRCALLVEGVGDKAVIEAACGPEMRTSRSCRYPLESRHHHPHLSFSAGVTGS